MGEVYHTWKVLRWKGKLNVGENVVNMAGDMRSRSSRIRGCGWVQ